MDVEMKSHMRATAPLRSSRSVYALQVEATNQKWYKCWYCTNLSHRPDRCHKFVAVSINQRIKIAKENHVCFSCMKAAGTEHRIDNWGRHRKCMNTDNDRECMHFIACCFTRALQLKLASCLSPSHIKLFYQ